MIIRQLPLGQLQTNCYIAGCEETHEAVIIDPGDEAARIFSELDSLALEVRYVLITHAHFDHIGAIRAVVKGTGAPLAMHELDLPLLRERGGAKQFGIEIPASPEPDVLLEEGTLISFGHHSLRTIFTPGHTPGHVAFYEEGAAALFDGDVLFAGGVGRTDLPGGNQGQLMESIEKRLLVLPDETTIYSGHGPTTTIGQEREAFLGYR